MIGVLELIETETKIIRNMLRKGCVIDAYEETQTILDLIRKEAERNADSQDSNGRGKQRT